MTELLDDVDSAAFSLLVSTAPNINEFQSYLKKQIQEEGAKLLAAYLEEQQAIHRHESDESEGDIIFPLSTPTSKLMSSQSDDTVPDSTEFVNFSELVHKNKRFDDHWKCKTFEQLFPIVNESSRLLTTAVEAKAIIVLELR
jgi:hypothetical protein